MKISVLYAEDNQFDSELTVSQFAEKAPQFQFTIVETAEEFEEKFNPDQFDIVLLDQNLPDADGLDILKELISKRVLIPIIMVTGENNEELAIKALRLGATNFISKQQDYLEFMPSFLEHTVKKYQRIKAFNEEAQLSEPKILYLDDDGVGMDLTVQFLNDHAPSLQVTTSDSSADIIDRLKKGEHYDLMLMDLNVYDINGIEFIRQMGNRYMNIPIVVITSAGNEDTAIAALRLGAYDYVIKDIDYLTRLPFVINNTLKQFQLNHLNESLHEKLQLLNEQLEEKNQFKSMFIASMSHELRTPLTAIMGFAGVLTQGFAGPVTDKQKEHLQRILYSAHHLDDLINDIIDSSKIDARIMECNICALDISSVLDDIVQTLKHGIEEKGLTLNYTKPASIEIETDKKRITQCLLNMISNAMKYTEEGTVTIVMEKKENSIEFKIQDTGIGISKENQKQLFQPFSRIDSHLKTKVNGTGLGLYITKKMIEEILEGSISVESEEGKGSIFTLQFPLKLEKQTS